MIRMTLIHLPFVLFLLSLHSSSTGAQNSVGSFFTAIYLNGALVGPSQISCSNMGQPQYCCASGQSCAWDDAGKVACCASGYNCQGSAYGSNAGTAGQYYTASTQTTTVYQNTGQNCNCASSTALNVVPIVPVTVATVLSPKTTSYYTPPASTYYPTTSTPPNSVYTTVTTTPAAAGQGQEAVVTSSGTCGKGYTTIVEANVGAPTRIVGCYVIINEGGKGRQGQISRGQVLLGSISFVATLIGML